MEINLKERSPSVSRTRLAVLPAISPRRPSGELSRESPPRQRLDVLEDKVYNLETANIRLVEIVFQLKNAMNNVFSNESTDKREVSLPNRMNQQFENRLKRIERAIENKPALHGKEIDLTESGFNQFSNRMITLNNEMENLSSEKTRLENSILKLTEEMMQLKNHFVIQGDLLTSTNNQYNNKAKRLHDEYLNNLDSINDKMLHTQEAARQFVHHAVTQSEFNEAFNELKHDLKQMAMKQEEQNYSYLSSESNLAFRVNELAQKLNDEKRLREVEIRRLDLTYQDSLNTQDSTRMILENHLSGLLSESTSKQMDRETFSRVNTTKKLMEFEKLLINEKETRNSREKEIHARINEVMERATSYQHESLDEMKQTLLQNQSKTNEALHQVESGMRLIERNSEETLRKYYQVVSAEIAARKKLSESVKSDFVILEERIRASTAAMQLAISGLANRIQNKTEIDELKQITDKRICEFQLYMSRNFTDIDAQLQNMSGQISNINLNVESRIAQATSDLATEVRETLSSVIAWQANSTSHLREMQAVRVSVMQELAKMQLTLNHIESEIPTQMTMETDERIQAIGDIRHQMESLKILMNTQPSVTEMDVDKIHESIRKLAETLQSIKSTMGMKIQSEQDMRLQQIKDLQTEMRYLEDQFLTKCQPKEAETKKINYIIKPTEDAGEEWHKSPMAFITLNHWSIYSIWKWTKYKEKLLGWKTKAIKNKSKNKKKKGGLFGKKSKK